MALCLFVVRIDRLQKALSQFVKQNFKCKLSRREFVFRDYTPWKQFISHSEYWKNSCRGRRFISDYEVKCVVSTWPLSASNHIEIIGFKSFTEWKSAGFQNTFEILPKRNVTLRQLRTIGWFKGYCGNTSSWMTSWENSTCILTEWNA
jgi:hypothetical protein